MRETPELGIETKDIKAEPEKHLDETLSGHTGGIPQYEVDQRNLEDARKAEKLADELKSEAGPTSAQTVEAKKPLDISFLKNKIKEIEAGAQKQNWFKRNFGSSEETLKRLRIGLRKIEDPKSKAFASDFEAAYDQGGEKFALEYAEAIGNGELVRPVDGVLMVSGKRSQENFLNNN